MERFNRKFFIIIIICVIIIIGIIIAIIANLNEKIPKEEINDVLDMLGYQEQEKVAKVTDKNDYYTIKKILDTYSLYVNYLNFDIENAEIIITEDMNRETMKQEYEQEGITILKDLLDPECIGELGLTDQTIKDTLAQYANDTIEIQDMFFIEKNINMKIFIVKGNKKKTGESITLLVKLNPSNLTFSIFIPEYAKLKNYDIVTEQTLQEEIKIQDKVIEQNENNQYQYMQLTDEMIINEYYMDYKINIQYDLEQAYKMLEESYRKKRFATFEQYKKYMEKNTENIINSKLAKYQVEQKEDSIQYIGIDTNDNYFIFTETAPMKYTLILDTYTVALPEYIEKYEKANIQQKGAYCIDRFIKIVNDENYTLAYTMLADSYKNNYFKTEEEFANYMKQAMVGKKLASFKKFSNEGEIYIYTVELAEGENAIEKTFMVQLAEGTDFKLSFNVQ